MAELTYPASLTDDLREVLGMMNFKTVPMAHAFILDWLIRLALEHGADWQRIAGETLQEVIVQAKAARAAAEAAKRGRGDG